MTLRTRLLAIIGVALLVLWGAAAVWMLLDLERNLQRTLDERLAMSARMVAGLLTQQALAPGAAARSARGTLVVSGGRGIACQVRSLRGEIIAATSGAGQVPLQATAPGYRTVVAQDQSWRTYTLRTNDFDITTADRLDERALLRRRIAMAAGIPFLIAAVGGLFALWIGVGRALSPVLDLQRQLAERKPDAIEPVIADALPGELRPLIGALNGLLERVSKAMQRERTFTSGAAHELRTPLTAIDTHLQVARLTGGETATQALDDAAVGVERMRATLNQLLMLARIEGQASFDDGERISGDEAMARAAAATDHGPDPRVRISGSKAPSKLEVPAALAVVALRNLIDNALKYSDAQRSVDVDMQEADGRTTFRVRDRGPGMTDEELACATQRFWRGSSSAKGTGLGLTLTRAVTEAVGGALRLDRGIDGGIIATLELPRSPQHGKDPHA